MPPTGMPAEDEVHVWTTWLADLHPDLHSLERLLSAEEQDRAARFHRAEDRSRYVTAHGVLRRLLGAYLSVNPGELEFAHNAYGKPALKQRRGQSALSFNLSHSGEAILCAFALARRVGVDVEAVRTDLDVMELAQGQFSPREVGEFQALDTIERTEGFFRCWTRKEAYVKARGEGLGLSLQQFAVSFGRNDPPDVRWAADDPQVSARWSVWDIPDVPGYAGAVVGEGRPLRLVSRQWIHADR